nr:hypothetical protein Iba_chr12aCG13120 [Ipomoea batatas]
MVWPNNSCSAFWYTNGSAITLSTDASTETRTHSLPHGKGVYTGCRSTTRSLATVII